MTIIHNATDDHIEENLKIEDIFIVKFDIIDSKYDKYINTLDIKVVNITDEEIISFYEIDTIPTINIYKNKNLIEQIEGYICKTELIKILGNNM